MNMIVFYIRDRDSYEFAFCFCWIGLGFVGCGGGWVVLGWEGLGLKD